MICRILALAATFTAASMIAAHAQSGSGVAGPSGGGSAAGNVSSATHCIDRTTSRPRLKSSAGAPGAGPAAQSPPGTGGPMAPRAGGGPAATGSGSTGGAAGAAAGVMGDDLQPCP
jgi:hypothetical protein